MKTIEDYHHNVGRPAKWRIYLKPLAMESRIYKNGEIFLGCERLIIDAEAGYMVSVHLVLSDEILHLSSKDVIELKLCQAEEII